MYLLFDCNNFFASCEQVFRPDWRRRPLVVLSNNDGCVISRSPEAKAMGIAMGEPYFKCRERLEAAGAIVCSANFSLYGDLSERIMSILEDSLPEVQQYSIDEAFARVEGAYLDWEAECRRLRSRIRRWTGITVSVGLAPSKTLGKLANETAKHDPACHGVLALPSPEVWQPLLERTPVGDIWGVGRRLAPRFHGLGVRGAAGLAGAELGWLRRHFGVHGERMALELRGISCIEDEPQNPRSQVMVSRSLREGVSELPVLRDVLRRFVEKAARTLRGQGLMASELHVVLRTSRYEEAGKLYANSRAARLPHPADDTRLFTHAAMELLEGIYRPGFAYKKIGVLLTGLQEAGAVQPTFEHPQVGPSALMGVLDELHRSGLKVHFGSRAAEVPWRHAFTSPRYTTRWDDLPEAR